MKRNAGSVLLPVLMLVLGLAAFALRTSLYAVAALSEVDDMAQLEQFSVSDLTVRRKGGDGQAREQCGNPKNSNCFFHNFSLQNQLVFTSRVKVTVSLYSPA